jgi:hypothetical protein
MESGRDSRTPFTLLDCVRHFVCDEPFAALGIRVVLACPKVDVLPYGVCVGMEACGGVGGRSVRMYADMVHTRTGSRFEEFPRFRA